MIDKLNYNYYNYNKLNLTVFETTKILTINYYVN